MADLLISRVAPGVALVRSVDPFDTFEIYRIERSRWQSVPESAGIYLLHGVTSEGKLTVYLGMSTSNMRNRIRSHHVNPGKNWFGILFAIPVASPMLCPAIEAELIGELTVPTPPPRIATAATTRALCAARRPVHSMARIPVATPVAGTWFRFRWSRATVAGRCRRSRSGVYG